MEFVRLVVGDGSTNCYIVKSDKNNCAIIDPGAKAEVIAAKIAEIGAEPKYILLTHGHYDHIGAVHELVKTYPHLKVYIGENDAFMLEKPENNFAQKWHGPAENYTNIPVHVALKGGDTVTLDELTFKVHSTPGHTLGGVSYECDDLIFSGDTLFSRTIGRVDLPGGNYDDILESIKSLYKLDGNYRVLPGHGPETSLDGERANNPYVRTEN